MLVKFFLIFVMSAGCALAMLCEQRPYELHKIHTTHHIAETRPEEIEENENLLRNCSYEDDFMPVKNLLKLYSEYGITEEEMARVFGCHKTLVRRFLNSETPALTLVTDVHEYFEKGGVSLVSPAKPKRTVSDRILDSVCGVGKSIVSCSPFSNSSRRASTLPTTAEEKQALFKKKRE